MSKVSASQGQFQQALSCEKRAFRIESDLIKHIPISELGAAQLRRLSRFELQLKLILSEIENKELKETTKQHKKYRSSVTARRIYRSPYLVAQPPLVGGKIERHVAARHSIRIDGHRHRSLQIHQ